MADSNEMDRKWLRKGDEGEAALPLTIVAFHRPVISPGPHGATRSYRRLPKLLGCRGVDLVLNGDDHLYARSRRIRGTRYVVTGGGGQRLYECRNPLPRFPRVCVERHHFLYVVAGRHKIRIRAVGAEPPLLDKFKIRRRSRR
jgi:hypothetical protein